MPSNGIKLLRRIALYAVGISSVFALSSSVLADANPKERTYGPYTIEQLKKPVVLGNDLMAVKLTKLVIDTIHSQYVPDIAEISNAGNRPTHYNTDKKANNLRLNISAVCSDETSRQFMITAAIAYDKQGRSIELGTITHTGTNFPGIDYSVSDPNVHPDYVGVYLVGLSPSDMKRNKVQYGGLVWSISPTGPAYKAGIRQGDVILKMGNTVIRTMQDGDDVLGPISKHVTRPFDVTIVRSGKKLNMRIHPAYDPIEKDFPTGGSPIWKELSNSLSNPGIEPNYSNSALCSSDEIPAGFEPYTISFVVRDIR